MKLKELLNKILNEQGSLYFLKRAYYQATTKQIKDFDVLKHYFENKKGIEIGGPSGTFRDSGSIPLYRNITSLDGYNFAASTLWEGNITEGSTYKFYRNKVGTQYISEATNLQMTANETYDFLLSSNCLEHIANPLQAVEEWSRVVRKNGLLLLALPNKAFNFDHNRPITTFEHLLDDYNNKVGEDDLTHFDEIMRLHDLSLDPAAGTPEQFRQRSLKNLQNRALHHHVFSISLLQKIFAYFNLEVLMTDVGENHIILGRKAGA
ncbi:class I SAM-dependent methyltransferase [Pontibacter chitinilyticus]|uniref:class I SAM-dependent methyltransferase n=1 Tax=Pontibacter chitinilyticus TaxID=2674989 RepID=UPI00321C3379